MCAQSRSVSTMGSPFLWGVGDHRRMSPPPQILRVFPQSPLMLHSHVFSEAHILSAHCMVFLNDATSSLAIPAIHQEGFKVMDYPINQIPGKCSMVEINQSLPKQLLSTWPHKSLGNLRSDRIFYYLEQEHADKYDWAGEQKLNSVAQAGVSEPSQWGEWKRAGRVLSSCWIRG